MDAKKLLKKHLEIHIPKGIHLSEKQMEQARYDASIDAINEALAIVPEPVAEVLGYERASMIPEIRRIINKVGSFTKNYSVIADEDTIIISQEGNRTTEVFSFNENGVDCDVFDGDEEVDNDAFEYGDLSNDVLMDILYLVEMVETDFDKTQDRIN